MATTPKQSGDVAYVDVFVLRPKTDPGEFRFEFFEDTGNHDRFNGSDVIDQAFGVAGGRARFVEVLFL